LVFQEPVPQYLQESIGLSLRVKTGSEALQIATPPQPSGSVPLYNDEVGLWYLSHGRITSVLKEILKQNTCPEPQMEATLLLDLPHKLLPIN
jgi:hypothetical protein